jgi:arsenite-transporting ATPase
MYFCLYRMSIDAVIMNRVLPDAAVGEYFQGWKQKQRQYMEEAEAYFGPVPILPVTLFQGEVLGYKSLKALAEEIYGNRQPLDRFFLEEPYRLIKSDGGYRLELNLPFLSKRDVELNKVSDELIIRVGSYKRHLLLPRQVAAAKSLKAKMEGQQLWIQFKGDGDGKGEE